jgi:multisubunit Na+/H+ antiporter MnhE subunit
MSAQSKSLPARLARAAGIALATWIALAGVWMLLVDNESLPELLVGAGAVCIATAGSELVRAQRIAEVRFRAAGLLRLWRPLARIPRDVGIVMWVLVRQLVERKAERGSLRALRFRASADTAGDNGRRALAELAGSLAPNTVVIGIDRRRNLILAHQLEPGGDPEPSLDPLDLR